MFTGLIEALGTIVDLKVTGTSLCLKIEAGEIFAGSPSSAKTFQNGLKIGDSIAVNGVCLTATDIRPPYFEVTAVQETLGKTTFGSLKDRNEDHIRVNLEQAATIETRLGGHLVQGHVDGVATLRDIRDVNGSWEFTFELPSGAERYVVPKGSITIDGISLTVTDVAQTSVCDPGTTSQATESQTKVCVTIAIIPHTYYHTNVQFLKIGDTVNVEFDIIAKMVERLVKPYSV